MVCTGVCRQSHWSQRAMRRESADTPRLAVDTSATVVAREFGWQNRMKRQGSIRTCKVTKMKPGQGDARGREDERAKEGGGNQRVPVCLALLRLVRGRTRRLASWIAVDMRCGCGYGYGYQHSIFLAASWVHARPSFLPLVRR